ncbi:MAG: C-type lectin domain-containing protein, partial [Bacteroidia bacterium]|nr:C-type lectin domain-containing protein [Bacteroidia bacterium]
MLTQLAKRNISLLFAIFLMANGLLSQVSYTCHFDNALQAGTVAFRITVNSGSSEETWTVSNVANLYSNIDPDILVTDGHVIPEDPFNPGKYRLTGYAYDGVMPFATVMNNDIPVLDMNMITCMSPSADIMGDMEVCMGATAQFSASISNPNLLPNKINWSTNGSTTFENVYGTDNLQYEVVYDEPGDHLVFISGQTINGFTFNANVVVSVHDVAEDYVIQGPMYLCYANNEGVKYSVNNPDNVAVTWSSTPAVNMITPLTGSGSMVEVDFPDVPGIYTLAIENTDPNGCTVSQVIKPVEIVAVVDTVSVYGDVHVCLGQTETYSVDPSYTNVGWTVVPGDPPGSGGFMMNPSTGSGSSIEVTYTESGTYDLVVSGDCPDGCSFESTLTVTVPGDEVASLACNNQVNVSLNNSCILELYPDMILEGDFNMNEAYQLEIVDASTGEVLDGNMIAQKQLGNIFIVTVTQECGGNSCWGTVVVEDKSITELEPYCPGSVSVTCFDFADKTNPAGYPEFPADVISVYRPDKDNWLVSGFDNCSDVILSYVDTKISADECADPQHIVRTWTAVDINNGLSSSCSVDIYIGLVDKTSIIWPPNWDSGLDDDLAGAPDTDNTYGSLDACDLDNPSQLLCNKWLEKVDANGNPSPACTGEPRGLLCTNLQLIGYKDQVIPICGNSKKILRKWSVWDACTNEDVLYTQIITIMDNAEPECEAPADKTYYTDTHECGSDIIVEPPVVSNECAGWSYDIEYKVGNYNDYNDDTYVDGNITWDPHSERYTIHNVSFSYDSIWVKYTITDICGNKTDDCVGEFELIDDEQPIPACDLYTSIALNNGGLAFAGPSTFDDNSWDNCGVFTKLIQRMDQSDCQCYERKLDFMHSLGEYNGHYYYLSKYKYNGRRAFNFAEALDGYVAVINNAGENTWLRNAVSQITDDPYYIGLKGNSFDVNKMYWDASNNSYNFNGHWASNEPFPDENYRKGDVYVVVNEDGDWEAERQTGLKTYYVVEFETKCGWSQKESFCCSDLGEETMVSMRVIDLEGNHNFCMVNVEVQDFSPPRLVCPDNTEIDCSTPYDLDDLSQYGYATAIDDCDVDIT